METYTATQGEGSINPKELLSNSRWVPLCQRESLSTIHIICICASMLAYQVAYSVEFALCSPILFKLGFSQQQTTVIWLAGPLSGFIVQPLIGVFSDSCRSRFGRRRPFIFFGCLGIILGFLVFYFIDGIGSWFGSGARTASRIISVVNLFLTNIFINVMQGPSRSLVADLVPPTQQIKANSIGSLMLGLAAVITNLIGGISSVLGRRLFSKSDEEVTFIFGMILIAIGLTLTMLTAKEEPFTGEARKDNPFTQIFTACKNIPPPALRISLVYFFSWMAYFPFQVQTTDFFGVDIYGGLSSGDQHQKDLYQQGVSFGMFVIAISNVLVLFYGPIQDKVVSCLGMRQAYAISQIIEAGFLIAVFWVKNKWVLLGLFAPLGISCTIFNAIPFAILGLIIPKSQMGVFMGVLNSFAVVGQQLSNFILGSGLYSLLPDGKKAKGPIIASGSFFALIAAAFCFWIIVPKEDNELLDPLSSQKPEEQ